MNLTQLSRALYLASRTVRDVNAVRRGKGAQRIGNRIIGRTTSRILSRAWFK